MWRRGGIASMMTMCPTCVEIRNEGAREFEEENKEWLELRTLFQQRFKGEKGNKRLEDGEVVIERKFRKQLSNSRKTSKWLMDFHLTKDGKTKIVADPSGPNRRSDPNRNWGLGRD
ncbi:hypothetical protein [Dankookia sp. P2]|uniref:hypothetical protein n=1 Tax=Dankookia sp. P2 TaxID=3423955 RepID=UPI003D670E00